MIGTLLGKESLRLKKNPGALMLLGLLVVIAILISMSWKEAPATDLADRTCWVLYDNSWSDSALVEFLNDHQPEDLPIVVTHRSEFADERGVLHIPQRDFAIELMPEHELLDQTVSEVIYHFPSGKLDSMAPAVAWFWSAWKDFDSPNTHHDVTLAPYEVAASSNMASILESGAGKKLNIQMIATMLLLAVQFFTCCHLYVSFSSQDRERGTLSAMALSPASAHEILISRLFFHLTLGMSVCALILLIVNRSTTFHPSSFLVLLCVGTAWLCVGTVITSLTKTQSVASMLMFCYMLGGGILFYLSAQFPIFRSIQFATFENHAVTLLHTSLKTGQLLLVPLLVLVVLTTLWATAATTLFRRLGWQS